MPWRRRRPGRVSAGSCRHLVGQMAAAIVAADLVGVVAGLPPQTMGVADLARVAAAV